MKLQMSHQVIRVERREANRGQAAILDEMGSARVIGIEEGNVTLDRLGILRPICVEAFKVFQYSTRMEPLGGASK